MDIELRRTGGIQEADVWAAADALLLAGQRPTIERVRQQLGRGSPNTVSPYLDRWFAGLGARIRDPQAFAPTMGLPDPIIQAAQHFWEVASHTARAEASQQLQQRAVELDARAAKLTNDAAALEANTFAMQRALEEAVTRADTATSSVQQLQATLQNREADLVEARRALQVERDARQEVSQRLETARAVSDGERMASQERFEAEQRRMTLEVDRARTIAKESNAHSQALEHSTAANLEQWRSAEAKLLGDLQTLRSEKHNSEQQLAVAQEKLRAAEHESKRAVARADAQLERVDRLQAQLEKALFDLRKREDVRTALLESIAGRKVKAKRISARNA